MGPFIPDSSAANYMGVTIHNCAGTFMMLVHDALTSSFTAPKRISLGSSRYLRPEMASTGATSSQIVILGSLSDDSDVRISIHDFSTSDHYYYDLGVSSQSETRGLYFNTSTT